MFPSFLVHSFNLSFGSFLYHHTRLFPSASSSIPKVLRCQFSLLGQEGSEALMGDYGLESDWNITSTRAYMIYVA